MAAEQETNTQTPDNFAVESLAIFRAYTEGKQLGQSQFSSYTIGQQKEASATLTISHKPNTLETRITIFDEDTSWAATFDRNGTGYYQNKLHPRFYTAMTPTILSELQKTLFHAVPNPNGLELDDDTYL